MSFFPDNDAKSHIVVIKPKYKTKQYYKKCVTQKKIDAKHKT